MEHDLESYELILQGCWTHLRKYLSCRGEEHADGIRLRDFSHRAVEYLTNQGPTPSIILAVELNHPRPYSVLRKVKDVRSLGKGDFRIFYLSGQEDRLKSRVAWVQYLAYLFNPFERDEAYQDVEEAADVNDWL